MKVHVVQKWLVSSSQICLKNCEWKCNSLSLQTILGYIEIDCFAKMKPNKHINMTKQNKNSQTKHIWKKKQKNNVNRTSISCCVRLSSSILKVAPFALATYTKVKGEIQTTKRGGIP
jgi:hypothetical protein